MATALQRYDGQTSLYFQALASLARSSGDGRPTTPIIARVPARPDPSVGRPHALTARDKGAEPALTHSPRAVADCPATTSSSLRLDPSPDHELDTFVDNLARRIASLDALAVSTAKHLLSRHTPTPRTSPRPSQHSPMPLS
jgi:hypothetical protein